MKSYIFYAIGEIFLVMIGILIALQVNNWNEKRKELNLANNILGQLQTTIANDTLVLNSQLIMFENMITETRWVIEQFENDAPYSPRMDTSLAVISAFSITEADYTAFNYLENVGIGIIEDQELRDQISTYYAHSKLMQQVDEYFEVNKYFRQVIYPKFFKRYRYGRYVKPVDYQALKISDEFRVVVDMCLNDASYYRSMINAQKERASEILTAINRKLNL
ncbi:MAG: hypothetical protein HWE09_02350 [Cyclobacteriaceae bacterium]|nr:hypothetical protein [Cyclobacteriaceae bacterium]